MGKATLLIAPVKHAKKVFADKATPAGIGLVEEVVVNMSGDIAFLGEK